MILENGIVTLGFRQCWSCHGSLKRSEFVPCAKCSGTGKLDPKKSKGRNCPECAKNAGFCKGKVLAVDAFPCYCTETATPGLQAETIRDICPREWVDALPITVYRSDRRQTLNENLFGGLGLYSCTDYGEWKRKTDEELIARVKERNTHGEQLTKVARLESDGLIHFAVGIGIFCNDQGYTPRAMYTDDSAVKVEAVMSRMLGVSEGMEIGTKLASEGLNGSMLACHYVRPE